MLALIVVGPTMLSKPIDGEWRYRQRALAIEYELGHDLTADWPELKAVPGKSEGMHKLRSIRAQSDHRNVVRHVCLDTRPGPYDIDPS